MTKNEDSEITESTDQKWICTGSVGNKRTRGRLSEAALQDLRKHWLEATGQAGGPGQGELGPSTLL